MADDTFRAGIFPDMPGDEYHAPQLGRISKSALDQVAQSPLHYYHWLANGRSDTPALRFGRAFHMAVLEPELFAYTYACEPDFGDCRRTANKQARADWRAEHADHEHISADDWTATLEMRAALERHPLASRLLSDGRPELTVRWRDEETGLPAQMRADYYLEKHATIVDIKSDLCASAATFRRTVATRRYHVQDALYRAGATAAGLPAEHFVFVVVEKSAPWAVAIYELDAEASGRGHQLMREDISTLADCLERGEWPGYPETIQTLDLPPWAL
jgi:hypothetical protein